MHAFECRRVSSLIPAMSVFLGLGHNEPIVICESGATPSAYLEGFHEATVRAPPALCSNAGQCVCHCEELTERVSCNHKRVRRRVRQLHGQHQSDRRGASLAFRCRPIRDLQIASRDDPQRLFPGHRQTGSPRAVADQDMRFRSSRAPSVTYISTRAARCARCSAKSRKTEKSRTSCLHNGRARGNVRLSTGCRTPEGHP